MHRPARTTTRRATTAAALAAVALPLLAGAATPASAAPLSVTKVEGAASNAAGLAPTVNAYRALLGGPDNGSTLGSQPGGRREINWDGVPDNLASPNLMPANLFNTAVPRGAVFSSPQGDRFQVSADQSNPTGTAVRFGNLDPRHATSFATFSPQRLFAPLRTTTTKVRFFVPGTQRPATVSGFGAVFTDVDRKDSTKIELYDRQGHRLWGQDVRKGIGANGSLSFLGVKTNARIFEVRITSGNTPVDAHIRDGGTRDVVVMDDLLYAEPKRLG
jgi:hypothetical protein